MDKLNTIKTSSAGHPLNVMVIQIQQVISKHIPDAETRNRIAEDLKELGL